MPTKKHLFEASESLDLFLSQCPQVQKVLNLESLRNLIAFVQINLRVIFYKKFYKLKKNIKGTVFTNNFGFSDFVNFILQLSIGRTCVCWLPKNKNIVSVEVTRTASKRNKRDWKFVERFYLKKKKIVNWPISFCDVFKFKTLKFEIYQKPIESIELQIARKCS